MRTKGIAPYTGGLIPSILTPRNQEFIGLSTFGTQCHTDFSKMPPLLSKPVSCSVTVSDEMRLKVYITVA